MLLITSHLAFISCFHHGTHNGAFSVCQVLIPSAFLSHAWKTWCNTFAAVGSSVKFALFTWFGSISLRASALGPSQALLLSETVELPHILRLGSKAVNTQQDVPGSIQSRSRNCAVKKSQMQATEPLKCQQLVLCWCLGLFYIISIVK